MNTPSLSIAHLLGRPKPAPAALATKRKQNDPPQLTTRLSKPAADDPMRAAKKRPTFEHLAAMPARHVPAPVAPVAMPSIADQIVAAAAKARRPAAPCAAPTGMAAAILAAGKKRRGEV